MFYKLQMANVMKTVFKSRLRTYSGVTQEQLWLDALPNITSGLYWGSNH